VSPTPLPADGLLGTGATQVAQGGTMVITGGGFAPGSTGTGVLYSDPVVLGRAPASAAGTITMTVRIPSNLTAGVHTLQLVGVDPSGARRVLSSQIRITAAGGLPRTGSDAQDALLIALALLGAGMLAEGTRLRRSPA
jgi:hexosaminidase